MVTTATQTNRDPNRDKKLCGSTSNGTDQYQNESSNLLTPYREQPRPTRNVVTYPRPAFSAKKRKNYAPISFDQQVQVSQGNTGSTTGRTPGLRPAAPLPRTFPLGIAGPPPHLGHLAPIWSTLTPAQQADVGKISLHEVEEGLARARVSAEVVAITDPDRHAIDLGTAEHERVTAPLISKLSVLRGHRATAHTELLECQARVTTIVTQERSTAAALTAEKRRHASSM